MTDPTPGPTIPATPTNAPALLAPSAITPTSSTPPSTPTSIGSPPAITGGLTSAVLSAAVIAALISAVISSTINTALARRANRLEERARVRTTLAEAYQAYADYKEFPYAVRRRRHDHSGEERIRLSEDVRRVQSRLSFYQAWTRAEDATTGAAYNDLIRQLRMTAGASMHAAWTEPALDNDPGMNISPDRVDLTGLTSAEEAFLQAAENHVRAITGPRWRRRNR